jgi:hypothetical protein
MRLPRDYGTAVIVAMISPMTLNSTKHAVRTATKRALVGAILALGALGGLVVGQANAMPAAPLTPSIPIPPPSPAESSSGSQSSATSVNDIKIGNRSQLSRTQQGAWYDIVGPTVGTAK